MPVKERLAAMKSRVQQLLSERKKSKVHVPDIYLMSIMNLIKEKLTVKDVRDVDKRTRESELVMPPGTGKAFF